MSFSTLNIGASGLYAAQRAVDVASQNVANAAVAGYSRQQVNLTAATPTPAVAGMIGNGVTITSVTRMHDQLADVSYRGEASSDGYAGARSSTLDSAQGILGPVDGGASATLDSFWSSFSTLQADPTNMAARDAVLSAGTQLAGTFNDASAQLTTLTKNDAAQVSSDVDQVNSLASQVAQLNGSIVSASASGESPNDLLDARDRALDSLSQLAGVRTMTHSNGVVDVFIGSSTLVRGTDAAALAAGTTTSGAPTVSFADGSSATPGGQIGGYLSVTSVDLPGLQSQLDTVANGLITALNTVHEGGTGLDGSTGTPFFTGSGAAGITVNPGLTAQKIAASTSGAANDGNNAAALFALRNDSTAVSNSGGGTSSVGDALTTLAGKLGTLAASAEAAHTSTTTSVASASQTRNSLNGVSTDEEMVDLVKYQHAYSAAAQVITTANGMLDTLINHLGI